MVSQIIHDIHNIRYQTSEYGSDSGSTGPNEEPLIFPRHPNPLNLARDPNRPAEPQPKKTKNSANKICNFTENNKICPKAFTTIAELRKHKRDHYQTGWYCLGCDYRFNHNGNFIKHLKDPNIKSCTAIDRKMFNFIVNCQATKKMFDNYMKQMEKIQEDAILESISKTRLEVSSKDEQLKYFKYQIYVPLIDNDNFSTNRLFRQSRKQAAEENKFDVDWKQSFGPLNLDENKIRNLSWEQLGWKLKISKKTKSDKNNDDVRYDFITPKENPVKLKIEDFRKLKRKVPENQVESSDTASKCPRSSTMELDIKAPTKNLGQANLSVKNLVDPLPKSASKSKNPGLTSCDLVERLETSRDLIDLGTVDSPMLKCHYFLQSEFQMDNDITLSGGFDYKIVESCTAIKPTKKLSPNGVCYLQSHLNLQNCTSFSYESFTGISSSMTPIR